MPSARSKVPLRALLIAIPSPGFASTTLVERLADDLGRMFCPQRSSFTTVHEASACTGPALRETIVTWLEQVTPGVPHLFYFHSHGGRVHFDDIGEVLHFLELAPDASGEPTPLLDIELSDWLTSLHANCEHNLTVIIDACYSGMLGRDPEDDLDEAPPPTGHIETCELAPEWVKDAVDRVRGLAAVSHPGIVRVTGSSPVQPAYLAHDQDVGRMTTMLLETLERLGDDWPRTSWAMLGHALRQRVIEDGLGEQQWVAIAGPRERLLFSLRETKPARSIGLVEARGNYWMRTGTASGTEFGDQWEVLSMLVDDHAPEPDFTPIQRASVCVARDPNLACLGPPERRGDVRLRPCAARLARVRTPMPVFVSGLEPEQVPDLDRTVWLCHGETSARQHLRVDREQGQLELIDQQSIWSPARAPDDPAGWRAMLELLEDRARAGRLLDSARQEATRWPETPPIVFELASGGSPWPSRLAVGDCMSIRVGHRGPEPQGQSFLTWFVSVVLIDPSGRPVLLSSSQPEGIELRPGEQHYIGQRIGADVRGLVTIWPELASDSSRPRKITLALLYSSRPIELNHLTVPLRGSDTSAFITQGLSPELVARGDDDLSKIDEPTYPNPSLLEIATGWGFAHTELWLCP